MLICGKLFLGVLCGKLVLMHGKLVLLRINGKLVLTVICGKLVLMWEPGFDSGQWKTFAGVVLMESFSCGVLMEDFFQLWVVRNILTGLLLGLFIVNLSGLGAWSNLRFSLFCNCGHSFYLVLVFLHGPSVFNQPIFPGKYTWRIIRGVMCTYQRLQYKYVVEGVINQF